MLEGDEEKQLKVMEREMRLGIIEASKKFQLWISKLKWRTKFKVQIFDLNNEINHVNLFLDLLFKPEKWKINYEEFAVEVIKMFFVKSKDQLADFLLKAISSKAMNNILASLVSVIPRPNLRGRVGKKGTK